MPSLDDGRRRGASIPGPQRRGTGGTRSPLRQQPASLVGRTLRFDFYGSVHARLNMAIARSLTCHRESTGLRMNGLLLQPYAEGRGELPLRSRSGRRT
jgi:hypothetical protein